MRICRIAVALVAFAFASLTPREVAAQTGAVRVLVSNGMKTAMEELQPRCERMIGHPLVLQFNSTAGLKQQIEAGDSFDVAMITSEAADDLIKQGKLAGDSRAAMGRVQLGIGIRAGAAKPDIHTPEALKRTLRATKSITYRVDGASRPDIEKMFERLGIAAELQPRIILVEGSGTATDSVASGKAELVITLSSEIMPVHGIQLLGPLPLAFQYSIPFEAAVSAKATNADAAKALIAILAGPGVAPVFKASGLDRRD